MVRNDRFSLGGIAPEGGGVLVSKGGVHVSIPSFINNIKDRYDTKRVN